uniref:Uncharacterized protein n=1 Tax=Anguilla anguilla TaxID=7936 RepID=A0A0E9RU03_ANGAN
MSSRPLNRWSLQSARINTMNPGSTAFSEQQISKEIHKL